MPVLLLTYTASGVVIPLVQYGALFVPSVYWTRLAVLKNLLKGKGWVHSSTDRSAVAEQDKEIELRGHRATDNNLSASKSQVQNHLSKRSLPLASNIEPAEEGHSTDRLSLTTATQSHIQEASVDVFTPAQHSTKDSTPAAKDVGGDGYKVSTGSVEREEKPPKLFAPERLKMNLLLDLAVLLTYGLAAPLLALAIVFKQITASVYLRLLVGKSLLRSGAAGNKSSGSLSRLEEDVSSCGSVNLGTVIFMSFVVFGFWSAMVFDMVADVYGNRMGGVASLVVFLGWAAVVCACVAIVAHMRNSIREQPQQGIAANINWSETVIVGDVYNDLYASGASSEVSRSPPSEL